MATSRAVLRNTRTPSASRLDRHPRIASAPRRGHLLGVVELPTGIEVAETQETDARLSGIDPERPGNPSRQTKQLTRGPLSARTIGVRLDSLSTPTQKRSLLMTPSNTHPGTAARGLRRAFLQAASGLLTARDRRRSADRVRARPRLEGLEDRCLLSITEFPVPTAGADPWAIATGPDGNLWFTERDGNKIGMINPTTHAITEFAVPTANSGPIGITAGPDGNLWFTEGDGNKIGMINPTTHAITEFATSHSRCRALGDHGGPRRQPLVHRDLRADQIGMINPTTHAITEFAIPTANADPYGITAGPDGNLWFTEYGRRQDRDDQPDDPRHHRVPRPYRQFRSPTGSRRAPTATSGSPRRERQPDRDDQPDDPCHHRVPRPYRQLDA